MDGKAAGATAADGSRPAAAGRRRRFRVAVIGGAGYVGSTLVPKLLERDHDVTVLDAFLYGEESMVKGGRRLQLVRGDIRDVESVVRGCKGADAIVHLGGLVGDPSCAVDAELTLAINLRATAMIAEVARGLGVPRLVFASSCAVYGDAKGVLDEESPLAPVSIYAQTKADCERLLMAAADARFCPTALRFGTFYGLSPRPRFDLVVNLLVAKAVREGSIVIFGGSQWRPFLHVEDGAAAIIACLQAPVDVVRGQAFNVGSDQQNHTLSAVAELICAQVPGVEIITREAAAGEANYRVSFAKIRRLLDFQPRRTLADGISEIIAAVQSYEIADYRATRYNNHTSLQSGNAVELLGLLASPVAVAAASS
jgi:nucleoside-diphosphate-sugar epimerase